MDLIIRLIPFLEPYPIWIKSLCAGWVVYTAFLVLVLVFGRPLSAKANDLAGSSESPRVEAKADRDVNNVSGNTFNGPAIIGGQQNSINSIAYFGGPIVESGKNSPIDFSISMRFELTQGIVQGPYQFRVILKRPCISWDVAWNGMMYRMNPSEPPRNVSVIEFEVTPMEAARLPLIVSIKNDKANEVLSVERNPSGKQ